MAATGNVIVHTPSGLEIKGRRRLDDGTFEGILEELQQLMDKAAAEEKALTIADLDLSQNKLSFEQFDALFSLLGAANCRVLRFRMFGCPTINDEVMRIVGEYLKMLTSENAPAEMHLSDCAITAEGWAYFTTAIEETDLYPVQPASGWGKPTPLYLRMENNYIGEEYIQEKVDAGLVRPYCKTPGSRPSTDDGVKINMVVRQVNGTYQQRQGEPPAPEEAGPYKQVHDKFSEQQQKGAWGGADKGWGKGGWGAPAWSAGGSWSPAGAKGGWAPQAKGTVRVPAPAALPAAGGFKGAAARLAPITPAGAAQAAAAAWKPAGAAGQAAKSFNAFGGGKIVPGGKGAHAMQAAGNAWARGGAADRSRTPVARQPANPPAKNTGLPKPWEEHWSEEYQIPYYWNAESGESAWEKPV
jgi:hypothetical protein